MEKQKWMVTESEIDYWKRKKHWHNKLVNEVKVLFEKEEWGVLPECIVKALCVVPRHSYVRSSDLELVYSNVVVPLNFKGNSTSSQPGLMALMMKKVMRDNGQVPARVLDVGSGSGYGLALWQEVGAEYVKGVEVDSTEALKSLESLKIDGREKGIDVVCADARVTPIVGGFEAVSVGVMLDEWPVAVKLLSELVVGGKMVAPVSTKMMMQAFGRDEKMVRDPRKGQLVIFEKRSKDWREEWTGIEVGFVEMRAENVTRQYV